MAAARLRAHVPYSSRIPLLLPVAQLLTRRSARADSCSAAPAEAAMAEASRDVLFMSVGACRVRSRVRARFGVSGQSNTDHREEFRF